jgi:fructose-1,6-bisphosphatase/sedoheptulose 1,7-bisphosphatase-like protein
MDKLQLLATLRRFSSKVEDVELSDRSSAPVDSVDLGDCPVDVWAALTVAHALAALRGYQAAHEFADTDESSRKREIDGAATAAAESVFAQMDRQLVVASGEGAGDNAPGAEVGQKFGFSGSEKESVFGVFDYVDGTTLTARSMDGAISIGAISHAILSAPDLQAYCLLVPPYARDLNVDLLHGFPEHEGVGYIREIHSRWAMERESGERFPILTHSTDTGTFHTDLIAELRKIDDADVIIPNPVIIEPNFLLSAQGLGRIRVDCMIGVFGFPEMVFACSLLDLFDQDWRMFLRPASLEPKNRGMPSPRIEPLFSFTEDERQQLRAAGLTEDRQYSAEDFVPHGSTLAAAIFAVTNNKQLLLAAPQREETGWRVNGFVLAQSVTLRVSLVIAD